MAATAMRICWRHGPQLTQTSRIKRPVARGWFLLSLVSLGSCAEPPPNPELASTLAPEAAPAKDVPPPEVPRPLPPPAVPTPQRETKPLRKRQAHVKAEREEQKIPALDPITLVGLEPSAIGGILGKPADMREVAQATRWTYTVQDCSLAIFFYPDLATGTLHALKYIVTDGKGERGDGASCVHHILLARSDSHG